MSEESQMDTLAYSSRMLTWAPLGKLLFVSTVLVANLVTSSVFVPLIVLIIGLALMAYSTNFKIPFLIFLALAEAVLILIIGCGMVSISGTSGKVMWDTHILWLHVHMTVESFNKAWLILFRGVAGIAMVMAFATSTPIPYLSQALKQIRMPKEVSELVIMIYRYGFLLLERMETMYKAAACRMGFNGFIRSIKSTASIAVGIFISSSALADKAQIALSCRNYRGYFPVYNQPATAGIKWILVSVAVAAALLAFGFHTDDWVNIAALMFGEEYA